jgi:hypothetical protein
MVVTEPDPVADVQATGCQWLLEDLDQIQAVVDDMRDLFEVLVERSDVKSDKPGLDVELRRFAYEGVDGVVPVRSATALLGFLRLATRQVSRHRAPRDGRRVQ